VPRQASQGELTPSEPKKPFLVEQSASFFPILAVVLIFRSYLFEPYRIPTGSMIPNLLIGDFIVVTKYSYGLRVPVLDYEFWNTGRPQRGDVVVFKRPPHQNGRKDDQEGVVYVKRCIGVPGDRIRYENEQLYLNDEPVAKKLLETYIGDASNKGQAGDQLFVEELPGHSHQMLQDSAKGSLDTAREITLGPEQYFMIGDNRNNSMDSRDWGIVPAQNLVGRADYIWFHWDWNRDGYVARSRLFTKVR
jgi:signal peptidase I